MLQQDPQIAAALPALLERLMASGSVTLPERGDALGLRLVIDAGMAVAPAPESNGVAVSSHHAPTSDGEGIELLWYQPSDSSRTTPGSAVVYLHGGGMIAGRPEHMDGIVRYYVQQTGACFAVPDYRLSPEYPGERMARDAFDAVSWLIARSGEMAVDPTRIAVMGDSGGGGVAAGAAILARDSGISLAMQILIYPMLDDRNTIPDPTFPPGVVGWDWDSNWTCWRAVLGDQVSEDGVSSVAAPARLADFQDLAPAYIEVGEIDIFRDESISYAQRLHRAGVSCELHVLPGVTHGHDKVSLDVDVSQRSLTERCRVLANL